MSVKGNSSLFETSRRYRVEPVVPMPLSPSESDARSGQGPDASLRDVFEAEESGLVRFAFGLVGRREVAEELVQEGFFRLHQHWREVENPRAWIYRAVRNLAISHLRTRSRETVSENLGDVHPDSGPAPDERLGKLEALGMMRLLLNELKEQDRELVRLKYEEGKSYAQIGEATGLSVGNVGYRLHHVLKGLAASLRQAGISGSAG
ncbi:MAG TPA: RNA polymerase sigma factor [Verrucomicrobiales bacterium]|nr:RNA polymerase sigma factor [Verrucomicrobiales bacterium]